LPGFGPDGPESWQKMKPKAAPPQSELFGAHFSELLNREHPLYVLAERIDWSRFDAAIDACYAEELGRPGVNTRLMVGLLYLKHAYDESDESVVARWVENPYWQFFCGLCYLQHELPIDPSSLSKWRKRVGAERLEKLLEVTIQTALAIKALRPRELQQVNVDTTVQEKAIAFPTDARLYHKMRVALVRRAKSLGLALRQNYRFKGQLLLAKQGRYAHARQLKRAAKMTRQLKTILGRVMRDIERKAAKLQGQIVDEPLRSCSPWPSVCWNKPAPARTSSTACMPPRWNASVRVRPTSVTNLAARRAWRPRARATGSSAPRPSTAILTTGTRSAVRSSKWSD
jgi:transposase, IS5 family